MKSRAYIRPINLPDVPRPATKTVMDDRYQSVGNHTVIYRHSRVTAITPEISAEKQAIAHRKQSEESRRKREIVIELGKQGKSDKEIAHAAGYAESTVNNLLRELKKQGVDIPPRKKGRKSTK